MNRREENSMRLINTTSMKRKEREGSGKRGWRKTLRTRHWITQKKKNLVNLLFCKKKS